MSTTFLALCYLMVTEICKILLSDSRNLQSRREEKQHNYNKCKCSAEFLCQCPVRHAQEAYSTWSFLTVVSSTVLTNVLQIHFRLSYLNAPKCDQAKKENFSELKNKLPGTSLTIPKSLRF